MDSTKIMAEFNVTGDDYSFFWRIGCVDRFYLLYLLIKSGSIVANDKISESSPVQYLEAASRTEALVKNAELDYISKLISVLNKESNDEYFL